MRTSVLLDQRLVPGEGHIVRLLVTLEEIMRMPKQKRVIVSTGSQGEPNSALSLMAAGEHKYFEVGRGDLVILSSRVIPGNTFGPSGCVTSVPSRTADSAPEVRISRTVALLDMRMIRSPAEIISPMPTEDKRISTGYSAR